MFALFLARPKELNVVVIRFSFMASTIDHMKQLLTLLVNFGGLGLDTAQSTLNVLQI